MGRWAGPVSRPILPCPKASREGRPGKVLMTSPPPAGRADVPSGRWGDMEPKAPAHSSEELELTPGVVPGSGARITANPCAAHGTLCQLHPRVSIFQPSPVPPTPLLTWKPVPLASWPPPALQTHPTWTDSPHCLITLQPSFVFWYLFLPVSLLLRSPLPGSLSRLAT